jgi:hypothetical protein
LARHRVTNFFQDLTVSHGGRPKRKATTVQDFQAPPAKWFYQKAAPQNATPVEIVFKDKKLSVSVTTYGKDDKDSKKTEVVSQENIDKPSSGKIYFKFSKMSFGVADLVIDGKYSKSWAEEEIARLRKDGKLRMKPPEPEEVAKKDDKGRPRSQGAEKSVPEAEKKARPAKKAPPNVDQPDPEAQVDL